ncbi:MAG: hypothetical protein Q8R47_01340 [Nanoarchaeota archaeon]|nr:hypothetical protein [Nanoarchaeota archaeon]
MEDWVAKKLLELGYDQERKENATYGNLISISRGYLGGLILLEGIVVARDRLSVPICDKNIAVSGFRTQNSNSLYGDLFEKKSDDVVIDLQLGYFSTLSISPLEKRFDGEGVCLDYISPSDRIYVGKVRKNTFTLVFEDIRKNRVASFEFWTKGEMLYVPRKG